MSDAAPASLSEEQKCTLFVRNLALTTTKEQLVQFFSEIGPVRRGIVVCEKKSKGGGSKGFGFVVFAQESDVQEAIRALGETAELDGRRLKLEAAARKGENKRPVAAAKMANRASAAAAPAPVTPEPDAAVNSPTASTAAAAKAGGRDDEEEDKRAVILFNLPLDFTDHQLHVRLRKLERKVQSVERDGARARLVFDTAGAAHAACPELDKREWGGAVVFARRPQQMAVHNRAKGRCRLIVRNLGFKVNEAQLRAAFAAHGPLVEAVVSKGPDGKSRGFGFVHFVCRQDAVQAVAALNGNAALGPAKKGTPVAVDFALSKHRYDALKKSGGLADDATDEEEERASGDDDDDVAEDDVAEDDVAEDDVAEDDVAEDDDDDDDDNKGEPTKAEAEEKPTTAKAQDAGVAEQRTVFVQNLLFETAEPAIRARFREFGAVRGVKLVKDAASGRSKGSAFVEFWEPASAAKAVAAGNPLLLEGRPAYAALAVDKSTAHRLSESREDTAPKRDKRHMYQASEGKVSQDVPKVDRLKRDTAEAEKKEKLRSPLFFMSPTRLSVRNLCRKPGEAVDSKALKSLALDAAVRGGKLGMVRSDEGDRTLFPDPVLPAPWPKVLKATVFMEDDGATSRGFGFVEFEQHVHALACLRVLNNNADFAWAANGGRAAMAHKPADRPRLIVSFAVENAAKVKAQQDRKLQRTAPLAAPRPLPGAKRLRPAGANAAAGAASSAMRHEAKAPRPPPPSPPRQQQQQQQPPPKKRAAPRSPADAPQKKKKNKKPETDDVDVLLRARESKGALFQQTEGHAAKQTRWFDV